ncbi:MAG TPA: RNA methyltransferase PUA domain-containing protein, partial [Candidatus Binataceae bacterium]
MKSYRRFAIAFPPGSDHIAQVEGAELHHLRDVVRFRRGDDVTLIDPAGTSYAGKIVELDSLRAKVLVKLRPDSCEAARPLPRLILAASVIKGPRMDLLVEKA